MRFESDGWSPEGLVVKMGHVSLVAFICLLSASPSFAEEGVRLSAKSVSTWKQGSVRLFALEGNPSIDSPGGRLSADAIVVQFDEKAAAREGKTELRVYSERSGVGSVTVVTVRGKLAVDDGGLKSCAEPLESEIVKRAAASFAAQAGVAGKDGEETPRTRAEIPAVLAADERENVTGKPEGVTADDNRAPKEPASPARETTTAPRDKEGGEATKVEAAPWLELPEGRSVITYAPIGSGSIDREMEKIGDTTRITVTGGIEITWGDYKMRAGNMVIYAIESADGKVTTQIYAEDSVKFITPAATVEASRLFYNSADNNALLVDAELYAQLTAAQLPLLLKADRVRSYAGTLYKASGGYATTCEFGRPHYRLQAKSTSIIPVEHPDGMKSALVISKSNTFYLGPVPVLRWPKFSKDIRDTYTPLKRLATDNSDNFGNCVYTTWNLYDFFGGETSGAWAARMSQWSKLEGSLDYRSKRGTGVGLGFEYEKPEISGELDSYYIKDRGTDGNHLVPPSDDRGRVKWRQRAYYDQYQIDTELYYLSDSGFQPEYYERETREEKAPETYFYVKRPWEHSQASLLYSPRLNDFQTQTERLPQAGFDAVGYPLWDGKVLYNSSTLADNARFSPDRALSMPSYQTQRIDTIHGLEAPLPTESGFTFTPFTRVRESYWDDDANGRPADRFMGSFGAKVATPPVHRVYDVSSRVCNINRLRHVVTLDATYEDVYNSTRRPTELLPFDGVELVDEVEVATVALRQRLQTKRDPVAEGDPQRVVNFIALDAEADYFPNPGRDNDARAWSDVRFDSRTAVTDDVSIVADGDYDAYADRLDRAGLWVRVDHSPRTTLSLGNRYIRTISSSVVTATIDHVITDRWDVSLVSQYDFDNGQMLDDRFVLRRKVHEYAVEFKVKYDKGRNDTTFGINIYPLGVAGIRRF